MIVPDGVPGLCVRSVVGEETGEGEECVFGGKVSRLSDVAVSTDTGGPFLRDGKIDLFKSSLLEKLIDQRQMALSVPSFGVASPDDIAARFAHASQALHQLRQIFL